MKLTTQQQLFVVEYLKDFNATKAAIRAGYSQKTAASQGERLLRHVEIQPALAAATQRVLARAELSAVRVLEEMRRVSFFDIRTLFDEFGNLKPMKEWTEEQGSAVAAIEIVVKNLVAGDGKVDTVHKIKVWDKPRTLEMLAKHYQLLTDVIKIEDDAARIQTLTAGRQRVAEKKRQLQLVAKAS